MIVEWFLSLAATINDFIVGLFPKWDPPSFLLDFDTQVNDFFEKFEGIGVWGDWTYLMIIVNAALLLAVVSLGIKVVRAAASYLPFIGGAG